MKNLLFQIARSMALMVFVSVTAFTVKGQTNTFPSSGNVGIGTTSPGGYPLLVKSTDGTPNIGLISTAHTFLQATPYTGYNTYYDNLTVGSGTYFRTSNAASADTNALSILANGNVGIGVSYPQDPLDVNGWITPQDDIAGTTTSVNAGITWYYPSPTTYGIYRTAGSWSSPNYQQLEVSFDTGIIIDGGNAYGKSGFFTEHCG